MTHPLWGELRMFVNGYIEFAEQDNANYFTVWHKGLFLDNDHIAVTYHRYTGDSQLSKTDWSLHNFDSGVMEEHHGHARSRRTIKLESIAGPRLKWKGFYRGSDKKWYEDKA